MYSVVPSLSGVHLFAPWWTVACQVSLSFSVSCSLPKFMSIESVMLFNHVIVCHPLLLLPSIFPASGSFPMSLIFVSIGQSIGASVSASILPMNIQGWFPLRLTGWSPCCPRDSQDSFLSPQSKSINSSMVSLVYAPALISLPATGKTTALTLGTFVGKVMPLL